MRPFGDFELDIRTIGTGTINVIPYTDDCNADHTADCHTGIDCPYPTIAC